MARCGGIKADGTRCRGDAMPGSEWCWAHDPAYAEERRRKARKGGRSGGRGRPGSDLADLKRDVRVVIEDVLSERISTGVGAVALQGYNTLIRAEKLALDVREQQDLEERLEQLEALLHDRDEGGRWGA